MIKRSEGQGALVDYDSAHLQCFFFFFIFFSCDKTLCRSNIRKKRFTMGVVLGDFSPSGGGVRDVASGVAPVHVGKDKKLREWDESWRWVQHSKPISRVLHVPLRYHFSWVLQPPRIAKLGAVFKPIMLSEECISDLHHNTTQYTSFLKEVGLGR